MTQSATKDCPLCEHEMRIMPRGYKRPLGAPPFVKFQDWPLDHICENCGTRFDVFVREMIGAPPVVCLRTVEDVEPAQ